VVDQTLFSMSFDGANRRSIEHMYDDRGARRQKHASVEQNFDSNAPLRHPGLQCRENRPVKILQEAATRGRG
jgi:hypothetical protein